MVARKVEKASLQPMVRRVDMGKSIESTSIGISNREKAIRVEEAKFKKGGKDIYI